MSRTVTCRAHPWPSFAEALDRGCPRKDPPVRPPIPKQSGIGAHSTQPNPHTHTQPTHPHPDPKHPHTHPTQHGEVLPFFPLLLVGDGVCCVVLRGPSPFCVGLPSPSTVGWWLLYLLILWVGVAFFHLFLRGAASLSLLLWVGPRSPLLFCRAVLLGLLLLWVGLFFTSLLLGWCCLGGVVFFSPFFLGGCCLCSPPFDGPVSVACVAWPPSLGGVACSLLLFAWCRLPSPPSLGRGCFLPLLLLGGAACFPPSFRVVLLFFPFFVVMLSSFTSFGGASIKKKGKEKRKTEKKKRLQRGASRDRSKKRFFERNREAIGGRKNDF